VPALGLLLAALPAPVQAASPVVRVAQLDGEIASPSWIDRLLQPVSGPGVAGVDPVLVVAACLASAVLFGFVVRKAAGARSRRIRVVGRIGGRLQVEPVRPAAPAGRKAGKVRR
jgi:hypothetical protein